MGLRITPGGRLFDTRTGRFLSRDPVRIPGQNHYVALESNPLNVLDPTGRLVRGPEVKKGGYEWIVSHLETMGLDVLRQRGVDEKLKHEVGRLCDRAMVEGGLKPGQGPMIVLRKGVGESYFPWHREKQPYKIAYVDEQGRTQTEIYRVPPQQKEHGVIILRQEQFEELSRLAKLARFAGKTPQEALEAKERERRSALHRWQDILEQTTRRNTPEQEKLVESIKRLRAESAAVKRFVWFRSQMLRAFLHEYIHYLDWRCLCGGYGGAEQAARQLGQAKLGEGPPTDTLKWLEERGFLK